MIGDGIIFTGVGDLFAALFLAHSSTKPTLSEALECTIATLQAVLQNTFDAIAPGEKTFLTEKDYQILSQIFIFFPELRSPDKISSRIRELKLIQSKKDIEQPNVTIRCNQ